MITFLVLEELHTLSLVLEWSWRKGEILPSPVLTVVLAGELVIVNGPVHVGVVDQDRLTAEPCRRRTIITHDKNVGHNLTAVSRLCSRVRVIERTIGQLRSIDEARGREQIARVGPARRASGIIRRRADIDEYRPV